MSRSILFLGVIGTLGLSCASEKEAECTSELPPALVVNVLNAADGTRICDAVVTASAPGTTISLTADAAFPDPCEYYYGPTPPPGLYEVVATRAGFADASQGDVHLSAQVTASCQANYTQTITLKMSKLP